jgi:hypothetical protein
MKQWQPRVRSPLSRHAGPLSRGLDLGVPDDLAGWRKPHGHRHDPRRTAVVRVRDVGQAGRAELAGRTA